MFSLYVGLHSNRMEAGIMGYTLPTHNPVRVAEEIATLDHMLQGRLMVGFTDFCEALWNRYADTAREYERDVAREDVAPRFATKDVEGTLV